MRTEDFIVIAIAAACVAFFYADGIAALIAPLLQPIPRKLGLQDTSPIGGEMIGRKVRVLESNPEGFKVELQGSAWIARSVSTDFRPNVGDVLVVRNLDGIVLIVEQDV